MPRSEDDLVEIMPSGDSVWYLSAEATRALAVLLHVFEDHPGNTLSPHLKPYLRVLDRKLVKPPGSYR